MRMTEFTAAGFGIDDAEEATPISCTDNDAEDGGDDAEVILDDDLDE